MVPITPVMEMRKKVLFVIDSLGCGGAEKSLVSLLPHLNCDKYEIHLWMLNRGGAFEVLLPPGIIIEQEPSYNLLETMRMRWAHLKYSLSFRFNHLIDKHEHGAETLWKSVGAVYNVPKQKYDVAIAYQQGFPTYLVAVKIQAKKKIAWINADIFAAGYDVVFNAAFYHQYDVIVPVSKKLELILEKRYPQYTSKYHCIYDILTPDIIIRQSQESIKEHIEDGINTVFVTTGRLVPPKNYILAVEAAKLLRTKGIQFKWYFIGEGSERTKIEALIDKYELCNNVILLGMRQNPYPYMARCTVYVQTSLFEGFGMTIAEAKILGKPVVSTNFDVVHDQLKHEENGLIAEMTPESVAENIMRLLGDKELCNHIIDSINKEKNTTYITEVEKLKSLLDAN